MAPQINKPAVGQDTINMVGVKTVPAAVLEKLQTIANLEGLSFNEIYNLAFLKLVEAYEAKNGKVKIRPKGKGLEGI